MIWEEISTRFQTKICVLRHINSSYGGCMGSLEKEWENEFHRVWCARSEKSSRVLMENIYRSLKDFLMSFTNKLHRLLQTNSYFYSYTFAIKHYLKQYLFTPVSPRKIWNSQHFFSIVLERYNKKKTIVSKVRSLFSSSLHPRWFVYELVSFLPSKFKKAPEFPCITEKFKAMFCKYNPYNSSGKSAVKKKRKTFVDWFVIGV